MLEELTRIEILTDCACRKCSLVATHKRLQAEADRLAAEVDEQEAAPGDAPVSQSKKKRVKEARKLETRVGAALKEGRIEEELKGVKMERVVSRASTKQAMIARVSGALSLWVCDFS